MEQKPPLPPSPEKPPLKKSAWPKMPGLCATRIEFRSAIRLTAVGAIAANFRLAVQEAIFAFLRGKWTREQDYRLIKEVWAFGDNRIAVRFAYEWHDDKGQWYRSYGNENWDFNANGLMQVRHASINDIAIAESDRKYHWPQGPRPADHPGLSDLGL